MNATYCVQDILGSVLVVGKVGRVEHALRGEIRGHHGLGKMVLVRRDPHARVGHVGHLELDGRAPRRDELGRVALRVQARLVPVS